MLLCLLVRVFPLHESSHNKQRNVKEPHMITTANFLTTCYIINNLSLTSTASLVVEQFTFTQDLIYIIINPNL